jgi:hypothetical protein
VHEACSRLVIVANNPPGLSVVFCALALGAIKAASPSESTRAFRFVLLVFILLVQCFKDSGIGILFWGMDSVLFVYFFKIIDLQYSFSHGICFKNFQLTK